MVCKLSIVVPNSDFSGAIIDTDALPRVGDKIGLGDVTVEVLEVKELLPSRGDFHFLHATCKLLPGSQRPA